MKKPDSHTVDQVFSDLQEYSSELGEIQLDDFAVRLDKMRYYRFGWRHFNVYYTVLACICLLLSVYSIGNYLMSTPKAESISYKINVQNKHPMTVVKEKETVVIIKQEQQNKSGVNKTALQVNKNNNNTSVLSEDSLSAGGNAYQQSSEPQVTKDVVLPEIKTDTLKPKTVVYLRKRDTIFTYDTIKVKKKRK